MKIFVSFSSFDREVVEPIVHSLRGDGHEVFFDRDTLPKGQPYDKLIETEINQSDLVVFCVSPTSVSEGKYSLTELKFASSKWPSAGDRVLPVMVAQVDAKKLPPYLAAVSMLVPTGNIAAETRSEVERISTRQKNHQNSMMHSVAEGDDEASNGELEPNRKLFTCSIQIVLALLVLGVSVVFLPKGRAPQYAVSIESLTPVADNPESQYSVSGVFRNTHGEVLEFRRLQIEFVPELSNFTFHPNLKEQKLEFQPGEKIPLSAVLTFSGDVPNSGTRWRLGITHSLGTEVGDWQSWNP